MYDVDQEKEFVDNDTGIAYGKKWRGKRIGFLTCNVLCDYWINNDNGEIVWGTYKPEDHDTEMMDLN